MQHGADIRRGDAKGNRASILSQRGQGKEASFYRQSVGKRLHVQALARFLVASGIGGGALGARYFLDVEQLPLMQLLCLAFCLLVINIPVFIIARRHRGFERRTGKVRALSALMNATIVSDFVFLTLALWLVGGPRSPFQVLYLLHVVIAAAFSTRNVAWAHAATGYALFSGLALGEWTGIIPCHCPVGLVNSAGTLDGRFVLAVLCAQGIAMVLGVPIMTTLTSLLQKGEEQLRTSNRELDRRTRMQRDFLHIALHDLKAPVDVAIMLAHHLDSLGAKSEEQSHIVDRMLTRLTHARVFLQDLAVLAALESANPGNEAAEVEAEDLVRATVSEHQEAFTARQQQVTVEIAGDLPPIRGVRRLLQTAIANLVSNANKYTPPGGQIVVRAFRTDGNIRIEVQDTGIGIAPEDHKRLFQEFVRLKRKDSVLGEVAGSGLGLSIVRRIAESHGGSVGAMSELDKGSTFYLELPLAEPVGREREEAE